MILPSKYIEEHESLLGVGAKLLRYIDNDIALSELWEESKAQKYLLNFERFILALDMLYAMGLISLEDQTIRRTNK